MAAANQESWKVQIKEQLTAQLWRGAMRRYVAEKPQLVVAVGGSVGKTSTKEAIASMLAQVGPVVKTYGNMATETGVPLSLLGFTAPPLGPRGWLQALRVSVAPRRSRWHRPGQSRYVLEYSGDKVGDTAFLTTRIAPRYAVLTALTPVHIEGYGNEQAMIDETVSIIDPVGPDGLVIANADDPAQRQVLTAQRLQDRPIVWYGVRETLPNQEQGIWAQIVRHSPDGLHVKFSIIAGGNGGRAVARQFGCVVAVHAAYQLYPVLAAVAVGHFEGATLEQLRVGVTSYQLPAGRGRLIEGRHDWTIIDDTGNASPAAVAAGLDVLRNLAQGDRRAVAVLGTMNELGSYAQRAHQEIAEVAADAADLVIFVGNFARMQQQFVERMEGRRAQLCIAYATPRDLFKDIERHLQQADIIFVKASQGGMFLERVVKQLMLQPELAESLLFRQERFWKKHHRRS
jgi:UDP-N-acetylmuramoyl-tripeptide--D-alanyl-D-alanine ligase